MDLDQYTLDSLADQAKLRFLETGKHPTDLVTAIAIREDLNDEQARRLCEATNVAIKKHKTHKERDPQAEFPLADWKDVVQQLVDRSVDDEAIGDIMTDKTASLQADDWEIFEEIMGDNVLEKKATAPDREREAMAVIQMLRYAQNEAAGFRTRSDVAKESSAVKMFKYLRGEAIQNQNINMPYTIALEKIGSRDHTSHDQVEAFFDLAREFLERDANIKLAALELVPIHGTINPSWSFLRHLSHYLGEDANAQKFASVEKTLDNQLNELITAMGRIRIENSEA